MFVLSDFSLNHKLFALFQFFQIISCFRIFDLRFQCPLHQMHLEKFVGFRPPMSYITSYNLIYTTETLLLPTFDNRTKKNNNTLTKTQSYNERKNEYIDENNLIQKNTTSSICRSICLKDDRCLAYVYLIDVNECYGYTYYENAKPYLRVNKDLPLVTDAASIFFQKSCLKIPDNCKDRLWILTKIPGNNLGFHGRKKFNTLLTQRQCAEKCLFESEFLCLSASFAPSYRHNRNRFLEGNILISKEHQYVLGHCVLNDKDKLLQPEEFRVTTYNEEYLENQCHHRPEEDEQCSYELYANSTFIYGETEIIGLSQKEVYCSREKRFYCQGISYYYENDIDKSECLLHSEDIISMGPRSLKYKTNSIYMRRVKCLDVRVSCNSNELVIKYTSKNSFFGKMYVKHHSKNCIINGNGRNSSLLYLPIGNEIEESRCGIVRAYEMTDKYQRTLISAIIIIQNNPNVQTHGDRVIKVGCIMRNMTEKTEN